MAAFDAKRQAAVLEAIAKGSSVSDAARASRVGRQTVYDLARRNEKFRAALDDAREQQADALEQVAWQRAVEGVDEPVFHQGEIVGQVTRYSNTLLIFLLKAARPAKYREHVKHEHGGTGGGPVEIRFSYDPKQ